MRGKLDAPEVSAHCKSVIEDCLREGFLPFRQRAGAGYGGSAVREAAKRCKVSENTLTSWVIRQEKLKAAGKPSYLPDWSVWKQPDAVASPPPEVAETPTEQAHRIGGTAADRRIIHLEDEVRRLNTALRDVHREQLDADAIRSALDVVAQAHTSPPEWISALPPKAKGKPTPEVPVAIWSDWHIGEVVEPDETAGFNGYNLEIAERRIKSLVDSTVNICLNHGPRVYPGIIINLLGDFVSGGLHPELLKTDEEEVIPATLRARDLLVGALTRMADTFGSVYVPCTAGNHGRATARPEFKRYVYQNYDWLIYQLLLRHFANDKRIHFDIRPSNDVHYKVYGVRYLAVHGDMLGVKGGDGIIGIIGPVTRGEVKKSRQSAFSGRDYDVLLMGHWHQPLALPRAIVANTLKGFDEYARLQLGAAPTEPSQPLWFVHPTRGRTSYWEVKVDDHPQCEASWVSWSSK